MSVHRWQLVPIEPTAEMLNKGAKFSLTLREAYIDMLSAAPEPPVRDASVSSVMASLRASLRTAASFVANDTCLSHLFSAASTSYLAERYWYADEEDARRYRWLREHWDEWSGLTWRPPIGPKLDAAIDDAMVLPAGASPETRR